MLKHVCHYASLLLLPEKATLISSHLICDQYVLIKSQLTSTLFKIMQAFYIIEFISVVIIHNTILISFIYQKPSHFNKIVQDIIVSLYMQYKQIRQTTLLSLRQTFPKQLSSCVIQA